MVNIRFSTMIIALSLFFATVPAFGATSITQYGITWSFDGDYPTGTFANGDFYVVAPNGVSITRITNTRHPNKGASDEYDGSQVNPRPGGSQGFDSRLPGYSASQNFSLGLPNTLNPNESLVSSTSVLNSEDSINQELGVPKPALQTVAVLTCLASVPPANSMRPPYVGATKKIYSANDINMGLLPSLAAVASTPSLSTVEGYIKMPQFDHTIGWEGTYFHPRDNFPDNYGKNVSGNYGIAALMLLLNPDTIGNKSNLAIYFCQLGIDLYHMLLEGGYWRSDGGHGQGRKMPILVTGLLMNDAGMLGIGSLPIIKVGSTGENYFAEDGSTFYVQETSPGVYNYGHGGYTANDVGMAEWGVRHTYEQWKDDKDYNSSYRHLNPFSHGSLMAQAMGLRDEWNNESYFDYTDRFVNVIAPSAYPKETHFSTFIANMWNTYRSSFGNGEETIVRGEPTPPIPDSEPALQKVANLRIVPTGKTIVSINASSDDGNIPANVIDNDETTRWSAEGDGQWIEFDLGSIQTIDYLSIGFYLGDQRSSAFSISVSSDRSSWSEVFNGNSNGMSSSQSEYDISNVDARYVRIIGYGNSTNNWNSITEVDIF